MGQDVDARTDIFAVGIILWELLAGQRLFLGETDFQTVKKVQASHVPSISQINKRVPQDLERIIARALARDPAQRHPTARALGQDLSKFMFRFGVPVSSFEIEQLVQGAMKERQRYRPQQASIIDKLIEEALLEFTSLTDDKGQPAAAAAASAGGKILDTSTIQQGARIVPGASHVDMGKWLEEISVSQKRMLIEREPSTAALPPVTEGNLAALEDEPSAPMFPRAASSSSGRPLVMPAASSAALLPAPSPSSLAVPTPEPLIPGQLAPRRSGAATRVGVTLAVVVMAAAGAAAWFTHLIPHF
jgi:serine/threonine-protein kinase